MWNQQHCCAWKNARIDETVNTRPSTIYLFVIAMIALALRSARADDALGFETNIRPILQTRCMGCHNPEKLKGNLDMTTYDSLLAGSSSGKIVNPGKPDESPLLGVIMHTREPRMPPSGSKIPDAEILAIRTWIQQGCRKTPEGAAVAVADGPTAQPMERAALGDVSNQLPLAWPLSDITEAERPDAVTSIAAHPGAPVIAIAGQQQVLIYHLPTQKLLGALPTWPGFPNQVRFSNDGRLLFAAGGVAARSGFVRAWSVAGGDQILHIDQESESVRAADIDVDCRWCAFGGPSGIVQIQDLATNKIVHRLEKHTDWITDICFSPDGLLLATADRAGAVFIWEAESHNLMHALPTHPAAVTSLAWRGDSNLLATACEDGRVRTYEPDNGSEVKSWVSSSEGTMCVRWSHDGRLVTASRDRLVKTWNADFAPARSIPAFADIALACTFDSSDQRIVASDYDGIVSIFDSATGALIGQLDANPPSLEQQIQLASQRHDESAQQAEADRKASEAAKAALDAANKALATSSQTLASKALELKRLRAAELREQLGRLRDQLAQLKRTHQPIYDDAAVADQSIVQATAALANARSTLAAIDTANSATETQRKSTNDQIAALNATQQTTQSQLQAAKAAHAHLVGAVDGIQSQLTALPDNAGLKSALDDAARARDRMSTEVESLQTQLVAVADNINQSTTVLATLQSQDSEATKARIQAVQQVSDLEAQVEKLMADAETRKTQRTEAKNQETAIETQITAQREAYRAIIAEVAEAFQ